MTRMSRDEVNARARQKYHENKANPEWVKHQAEVRKQRYQNSAEARKKASATSMRWVANHREAYRQRNGQVPREQYREANYQRMVEKALEIGIKINSPEDVKAYRKEYHRRYRMLHVTDRGNTARNMKEKCNGTIEEYDAAYDAQGGHCKICGIEAPRYGKGRLTIDHCHRTGRFRALLCGTCNTMIGHAREDVKILNAAIAYLVGVQQSELDLPSS